MQQSTQHDLVKLQIVLPDGRKLSIKRVYDEINIFENIMFPCTSGNIVIRDAVGLASKINFDGSERINIEITKDWDLRNEAIGNGSNEISVVYKKEFVVYKKTDRKQLNQNTEVYTLHFVSAEFLLSQQKKVRQSFTGTYTDIVRNVLTKYLGVKNEIGDISNIYETKGIHHVTGNNMSPIDLVEYVTKRASSNEGVPDMVFYQTRNGFNFMPLSTILSFEPRHYITFGAKNVYENIEMDISGARDFRIVSQFDSAENIRSGVYAGTFIGFDPLTRTIKTTKINYGDTFKKSNHANAKGINTLIYNKENQKSTDMYDSRITVYPFQLERANNTLLKSSDKNTANIIDDSHNYILQRKAIFSNLMQKRIRVVMPGNFNYLAGDVVQAQFPKQYNQKDSESGGDNTLNGKYIVVGLRHIIRFDTHETILEIATDSTNYGSNR